MADTDNIIIPPYLLKYFEERRQLRKEFDESHQWVQQLDALKEQVPDGESPQALLSSPLTREQTPLAELKATLSRLRQQLVALQRLQREIQILEWELQEKRTFVTAPTPDTTPSPTTVEPTNNNMRAVMIMLIFLGVSIFLCIIPLILILHR